MHRRNQGHRCFKWFSSQIAFTSIIENHIWRYLLPDSNLMPENKNKRNSQMCEQRLWRNMWGSLGFAGFGPRICLLSKNYFEEIIFSFCSYWWLVETGPLDSIFSCQYTYFYAIHSPINIHKGYLTLISCKTVWPLSIHHSPSSLLASCNNGRGVVFCIGLCIYYLI